MAQIHDNTETAVANEALSHIREPQIVDIDSSADRNAKIIRTHFASVRDALQRRYDWNHNKTRASLTAVSPPPEFGFCNQFALPNAPRCLRVREVAGCRESEWSVEGLLLLCNRPAPLRVIYSRVEVSVAVWDVMFRNAFGYALAAAIAPEIAKDPDVIAEVNGKARDALLEAFPVDAKEGGEDELPEPFILSARR